MMEKYAQTKSNGFIQGKKRRSADSRENKNEHAGW